MPNEFVSLFDSLSELEKSIPTRTQLYDLQPKGIGTPMVESLASFASRLAYAHSNTVIEIIKYVIEDRKVYYLSRNYLNGYDAITEKFTYALEKILLRNDLRFLSTLLWEPFVKKGYLRKDHKVWCASCFYEWSLDTEQTLYEPLIWNFEVVDDCYIHRTPLSIKCHNCQGTMEPCENLGGIGFCKHCGHFLGIEAPKRLHTQKEHKLLDVLGSLVTDTPQIEKLNLSNNVLNDRLPLLELLKWADYEGCSPIDLFKLWTNYQE